ncbi:MAG TPA: acyl-CoA dehydrogenase family protein [Ilumatobacteraceae bacterium]
MATHEVLNQPPPLEEYDVAAVDAALLEGIEREGAGSRLDEVHRIGRLAGDAHWLRQGDLANRNEPVLHTHDRYGNRIDEVEYHPAYHSLMQIAVGEGLAGAPWADDGAAPHVVRAAKFAMWTQVEAGHGCPVSMTYSIVPALRAAPDLAARWEPLLTNREYDPAHRPAIGAAPKVGALAGMAMTEKQGGSDVRANTTRAVRAGDGAWAITGHKWFCSAPMCDLFLTLAYTDAGMSCFAMPRWLPDGSRNAIEIQRLKDKLGNRSNASSEIELDGACAFLVGDEGRGIPTILEMVNHTRLDCVIGVTGQQRAALAQAMHHAAHRSAFGRRLVDQPLMRNVLADLAIESEATTTLMLRLAGAYDRADHRGDAAESAFARVATAVAKYWVCKRTPVFAAEALECLGGAGYVEDSPMPRLFRESPLNGIWEGSGNVICLDVLRALAREPDAVDAFLAELRLAAGADRRFDQSLADLETALAEMASGDAGDAVGGARRLVERMALALQGALLVRHATPAVADGFCASRLGGDSGRAFGTLPPSVDLGAIIDRSWPLARVSTSTTA